MKFKGITKITDYPYEVTGNGCYTDQSNRQFIITDEPVERSYVQVQEILIV